MPSGRYCAACGEMDYSDMGDRPCACSLMAEQLQQPPGPTVEDECAAHGHAYHGDDGAPPRRCWCGQREYPAGGPVTAKTAGSNGEALAPSDSDVHVDRCHDCWGWFPRPEFTETPEAALLTRLGIRVTNGRHASSCRGVCRVPNCESHGADKGATDA